MSRPGEADEGDQHGCADDGDHLDPIESHHGPRCPELPALTWIFRVTPIVRAAPSGVDTRSFAPHIAAGVFGVGAALRSSCSGPQRQGPPAGPRHPPIQVTRAPGTRPAAAIHRDRPRTPTASHDAATPSTGPPRGAKTAKEPGCLCLASEPGSTGELSPELLARPNQARIPGAAPPRIPAQAQDPGSGPGSRLRPRIQAQAQSRLAGTEIPAQAQDPVDFLPERQESARALPLWQVSVHDGPGTT